VIPGALVAAAAIIGSAVLATIVLSAIGLIRVARKGARLQERLDGYGDLPVVRALQQTQIEMELARAKLGEIEVLLARAQAATDRIRTSLNDLATTFGRVRTIFSGLGAELRTLWRSFGRSAKRQRSRGS
jgi:hypothetical protein